MAAFGDLARLRLGVVVIWMKFLRDSIHEVEESQEDSISTPDGPEYVDIQQIYEELVQVSRFRYCSGTYRTDDSGDLLERLLMLLLGVTVLLLGLWRTGRRVTALLGIETCELRSEVLIYSEAPEEVSYDNETAESELEMLFFSVPLSFVRWTQSSPQLLESDLLRRDIDSNGVKGRSGASLISEGASGRGFVSMLEF